MTNEILQDVLAFFKDWVLLAWHYSDYTWASGHFKQSAIQIFFNSLLMQTTKKTPRLHITGPLWRESTTHWVKKVNGNLIDKVEMPTQKIEAQCEKKDHILMTNVILSIPFLNKLF